MASPSTTVVTGAASGVGRAVATLFADRGVHVVVCDRDQDSVEAVVDDIEEAGGIATAVRADVRDEFDVERCMETAARAGDGSGIDCVVAAAQVDHGDSRGTPLAAESYAAFDDSLRTNTRGAFATVREAVPHLTDDARVFVPSSGVAREPTVGRGTYGVSKAGAEAVTLVFAAELDQVVGVLDVGGSNDEAGSTDVASFVWWAAVEADAERVDGNVVDIDDWSHAT